MERWNPFSRIRVIGDPARTIKPSGWGFSTTLPAAMTARELHLDIDSYAGTELTAFNGDTSSVGHLKYDVTNVVHYLRPVVRRRRGRHRRRPRHPLGAGLQPAPRHRRRNQSEHSRAGQRPVRRLHRSSRSRPAGALRQRRGAQLPGSDDGARRHHPDLADRHLGGDGQRRVRADRELALHARGLDPVPGSAVAARRAVGLALVLRRSARRGLPQRGAGDGGAAATRRDAPAGSLRDRPGEAGGSGRRTGRHRHDPGVARSAHARRSRHARIGRGAAEVRHRPEPAHVDRRHLRGDRQRRPPAGAARRPIRSTSARRPTTARSSSTCSACGMSSTSPAGRIRASSRST